MFWQLSHHLPAPAREGMWGVCVQGYHFTSLERATTIISLNWESKLAVRETEGIEMEGNRADLISLKYL